MQKLTKAFLFLLILSAIRIKAMNMDWLDLTTQILENKITPGQLRSNPNQSLIDALNGIAANRWLVSRLYPFQVICLIIAYENYGANIFDTNVKNAINNFLQSTGIRTLATYLNNLFRKREFIKFLNGLSNEATSALIIESISLFHKVGCDIFDSAVKIALDQLLSRINEREAKAINDHLESLRPTISTAQANDTVSANQQSRVLPTSTRMIRPIARHATAIDYRVPEIAPVATAANAGPVSIAR